MNNRLKERVLTYWMKLSNLFKQRTLHSVNAVTPNDALTASTNPYINARREWNHMFGDIIKAKYNWQIIAMVSALANILLIIGFIIISTQTRLVPYAIKVDGLGNARFAGLLQKDISINPLEINAFIRRYILNVRQVIADPIAQKQNINYVYHTSMGKTLSIINHYYRQHTPFDRAQHYTIEAKINSVLVKSPHTWQVGWTETRRDLDGTVTGTQHWEALIRVNHHAMTSAEAININPLGLFVTSLSWSQQT